MPDPQDSQNRHSLWFGLALMFALTWPVDLAVAAESRGMISVHIPEFLRIFVGYGFVVAAVVMTGATLGVTGMKALLGRFLIWRVGIVWYAIALLGYLLIDLAAIGIYAATTGQSPDFQRVMARQISGPATNLWLFAPAFWLFNVFANGEEIGWRGYVLPRLQARHSAWLSSLIVGVFWAVWHIPKYLVAGNSESFALAATTMIARAFVCTWIYNNTRGSLLLVTLFHASGNAAFVCLPIAPSAIGDYTPFAISVAIECLAAVVVVILAGPKDLSRRFLRQIQE
jgi:membrane protease YdiL (CAAX protease family)